MRTRSPCAGPACNTPSPSSSAESGRPCSRWPRASAAEPAALPAGLPSDLLERRPGHRRGRTLPGRRQRPHRRRQGRLLSGDLADRQAPASRAPPRAPLFRADSRIWSIGPSLYLPIFQGGRNRANLERSRAAYDESVAAFRQQVLVAFREVQDALTATRLLAEQSGAQERALRSAGARPRWPRRATTPAMSLSRRHRRPAHRPATERASVQLDAERLNTSVALIKALGGGWRP